MLDGSVRVFLAEALLLPTGLVTAAVLTRTLGPAGYGLLTLAALIVAWIEWTLTSLTGRATIKAIGSAEDWRPVASAVTRLHMTTSVVAALALWLLAPSLAALLHEASLSGYLRLFALNIPLFSLAQAHQSILVGLGRFRPRALAAAGYWIGRLVLIVVLVELGLSVAGAILGSIGASAIALAISRRAVRPPMFTRASMPMQQLLGAAAPLSLCALSLMLFNKLDLLALKILGGTAAQAGLYGAAQNLCLVANVFALSFAPLVLSSMNRLMRDGDELRARTMGRDALRATLALLPFAGLIAGAAPDIVGFVFGSGFVPAAPLLSILILGAAAMAMISVATAALFAANRAGLTLALSSPLVPLALLGHLWLIPSLGAVGAALVTTLLATLGATATVIALYRVWKILPPAGTCWRVALLSVAAYGLSVLWPAPGWWLLVKVPAIGLGLVLGFLWLGELSEHELTVVRSLWRGLALPEPSVEKA